MRRLILLFVLLACTGSGIFGQMTIEIAKDSANAYGLGAYSYHSKFIGHDGYAAPVILTEDKGAALFGDYEGEKGKGALLVKLDPTGKESWTYFIVPEYDELEAQSVVEDQNGNLYVFMISYNYAKHRGGTERVLCIDQDGKLLWDKTLGEYGKMNNPHCSYIHLLEDGRLELRGHIVTENPEKDKDPEYRYWQGWLDNAGELSFKVGEVIDWANEDWQKWYEVE